MAKESEKQRIVAHLEELLEDARAGRFTTLGTVTTHGNRVSWRIVRADKDTEVVSMFSRGASYLANAARGDFEKAVERVPKGRAS